MAQPPDYTRQYDFTDWQTTHPSDPLPADQVDAELNAVKQTTDAINDNLALIQRDDGLLANNVVTPDSLSTATRAMLVANDPDFKGAWVTGTAYAVGESVTESNVVYLCAVAHTAGTFATDYAAGKWIEIVPNAAGIPYDNTASGLAAEDVKAAIDELASEKADSADLGDSAGLDVGTDEGTVAAGDHDHSGVYAADDHGHSGVYEPVDATIVRTTDGRLPATLRNIPQVSKSEDYTLVLADAEKHVFHPDADASARTWTIPANASVAFPVGTAITFVNGHGAGVVTIAITSDVMRLSPAGTIGNRSLAADGIATALKVAATEWKISGTGLT
jgi:hypothetical protein